MLYEVITLEKRLAAQHLALELSDEAKQFIAAAGYDPVYGARPLKRYIQHQLETRIGRAIIAGELSEGMVVRIAVADGVLAVQLEKGAKAEGFDKAV